MPPRALYNENDKRAAAWLRWLISEGLIADGDVDERSIRELTPADLEGYTQVHFFAGIGGWSLAARAAGWPDSRPLWTGSCPCQPFSPAGKGLGADDPRHLWPDFFRLLSARGPAEVVGEQVAGADGKGWLDGVRTDLAARHYALRAVDIPSCAVDSPQIRQRLYWAALCRRQHAAFLRWEAGDLAGADDGGRMAEGGSPAEFDRVGQGFGLPERGDDQDRQHGRMAGADGEGQGGAERAGAHGQEEGRGPRAEPAQRLHVPDGERAGGLAGGDHEGPDGLRQGRPGGEGDGPSGRGLGDGDAGERGRGVADGDRAGRKGKRQSKLQPQAGQSAPRRPDPERGDAPGAAGAPGLADGAGLDGDGRQLLEVGGPERRTAPAGHDAGEFGGVDLGSAARWRLEVGLEPGGYGGAQGWGIYAPGADVPNRSWWGEHRWIVCHDGKVRRLPEPAIPLLAPRISGRVVAWSGMGNAINAVLAAETLVALREVLEDAGCW